MIPILYQENETNFNTNGIGMLYDTISYKVIEERNASFELELEYPAGGRWASELSDLRLISAKPNDEDESHLFRIYEIVKNLEEQTITVYAASKSNDLGGNLVQKVSLTNVTPQQALTAMKADLVDATSYNFISDIQTLKNVDWEHITPLTAILGTEKSLIKLWGGEIKRTNDTIFVYSRRGTDKVTTIRPGKGLDGFKMTTSTKGMITSILPFVKYTPKDSETEVIVRGTRVNSPLMNNYPVLCLAPIDYSYDRTLLPEGEMTQEQFNSALLANINAKASTYFTTQNPGCDKPKVTIDVTISQLSDSSEYEQFKKLEHIVLTDSVIVWVEKYNVDVEVTINSVVYNGMSEMVESFKAGNAKTGLMDDVRKHYDNDMDKIKEYVSTVENGIYNTIRVTAEGKNNIFSGYTEPDESLVKEDDIWYKPVADGEIEMYRWTNGGWTLAVGNASKLAIGSIDANIINLVNLNASNISTGTITGANGGWDLNTGEFWLGSAVSAGSGIYWNGSQLVIKISSGENLEDAIGETVESVETEYFLSDSPTSFTGSGQWSTTPPVWVAGKSVWMRTHTYYKDGSYTTSDGINLSNIAQPQPGPQGPQGLPGYTPVKGTDYFDGQPGTNGASSYLWIRYSQNANGNPMTTSPTGAKYIGTAVTTVNTAPTGYASYSWSLIKGTDGLPGEPGVNGQTSYLHIKYSNDGGVTFTANAGETVGSWIGTYVDFVQADSASVGTYTWNKIKGEPGYTPVKGTDYFDGVDGQPGPPGAPGTSSYLWVRYSQNASGDPMTTDPTGAKYIGVATTSTAVVPVYWSFSWSLIKGADGLPGEDGVDGQTSYLHIKYSNDGGTTFTANSGETVGAWIGTYVDFTAADSMTPGTYTWNKIKGEPGYTPVKGTDYFDGQPGQPGTNGTNGSSSYLWVRYSQNATGNPMVTSPTGALYIGIATTTTAVAPTGYTSYSWSLIKGTDGVKGETGANGQTSYLHIKYSNDGGVTFTANSGETVGDWIGTYVDFTAADSLTLGAYTWNKIKGASGNNGVDGATLYTWIRYADTPTTGMSDSPSGKLYIGIAHNKTTPTESSVYTDYNWSLIKGEQGIPGNPGTNGVTTYTWIKYADTVAGAGMTDTPTGKRFLGLAHNKTTATESSAPGDYTWSPLYDNVVVGGRNLVVRHDEISDSVIDTAGAITSSVGNSVSSVLISVTPGEVLTFTKVTTDTTDNYFRWKWLDSSETYIARTMNNSNLFQWTVPANAAFIQVSYPSEGFPQIENGNIATGWGLSPEDLEFLIADRATNDDLTALGNVISDLAGDVLGKADAGELEQLMNDYNTRIDQDIIDKAAVSQALTTLEGRTITVENILGDKIEKWSFIETSITHSEEGIFIGNESTQMGVLIGASRISFMDKGTEVAYISNKTMQISHGIFVESAVIGKHKIETIPGTDITIFTYVG